ncbi:hypothetical protein [Variovorax saccharolyticus]|uniref:hypothetical protein n=1 Tax=Variovorax saccharolyticus TaxID=3053516 RepID=UPI002575B81D|nr:hypothetical protein [Variovorax sp. J31P216]MDM0029608.1 hypothetical protein [Variovorax sp. J31P216]
MKKIAKRQHVQKVRAPNANFGGRGVTNFGRTPPREGRDGASCDVLGAIFNMESASNAIKALRSTSTIREGKPLEAEQLLKLAPVEVFVAGPITASA